MIEINGANHKMICQVNKPVTALKISPKTIAPTIPPSAPSILFLGDKAGASACFRLKKLPVK